MRFCFLFGLSALLATAYPLAAQTLPAPADSAAPRRLLLKIGLSPGRLLPQSGYHGFQAHVSPSVGLEYQFSPRFSLAGQVEADFLPGRVQYFDGSHRALVPSGEAGLMLRYYYNQADRIRRQRAHGPFVGNYLALGMSTEVRQGFSPNQPLLGTSANLYWGLQRRLGHHFLYDFNIGAGVKTRYYSGPLGRGYYAPQPNAEVNLRVYFVR